MAAIVNFFKRFWWLFLVLLIVVLVIVFWGRISANTSSSSFFGEIPYISATPDMTPEEIANLAKINEENKKKNEERINKLVMETREGAWYTANSKLSEELQKMIAKHFAQGGSNKQMHDWLTDMWALDRTYGAAHNLPLWHKFYDDAAKAAWSEWKSTYKTNPKIVPLGAKQEFNVPPSDYNSANLSTWY